MTSTSRLTRKPMATLILGLASALLAWLVCRPWDSHGWMIGAPFGRDYVNFWLAPRLVMSGEGARLIDLPSYELAIKQLFAMQRDSKLLFVYPPHALLLLAPFACLPFVPALLAWTSLNLAALALATRLLCPRAPRALVAVACISPPALVMVIYGHFGGFLALASTVALLDSDRRPWLAGLSLAFVTVKPQYAAALGLILLFAGRWRCLLVAALGTVALVALSCLTFGIATWTNFLTVTMPMQSAIVSSFRASLIETSVTIYFTLRIWHVPAAAAWATQAVVAAAAFATAVLALRRRSADALSLLVALLAALVMQPYVSHYDLAIVAPALTLVLLSSGAPFMPIVAMTWVAMPLARILYLADFPILGPLVAAALLAAAVRLLGSRDRACIRPRRSPEGRGTSSSAAISSVVDSTSGLDPVTLG